MTHSDRERYAASVHSRRAREEEWVVEIAAERQQAMIDKRRAERRLVLAATAGELSWRRVAALTGVTHATLRAWGERVSDGA